LPGWEAGRIYPVWADGDHWLDCVPPGTGEIQYADARREKYEQSLAELLRAIDDSSTPLALPDVPTPELPPGVEPRNPYKGLFTFTEKDAVGMYPQGAATCGALDTAGNLWEWCLNDYSNSSIIGRYSNNRAKVLRGGSFNDFPHDARAANRSSDNPYNDFNFCGLRSVFAPIIGVSGR